MAVVNWDRYLEDGRLSPRKIAEAFGVTEEEVTSCVALDRGLYPLEQDWSDPVERLCHDMIEIITRIERRFETAADAFSWYSSEPVPGFSGRTALELVIEGRSREVLASIEAVDSGVHA